MIVSFIPYFRLLVFGILVTLVAWFSFCFFLSCSSCLAKCKQRLHNIFLFLWLTWPKTKNQKWDEQNKRQLNKTFGKLLTLKHTSLNYNLKKSWLCSLAEPAGKQILQAQQRFKIDLPGWKCTNRRHSFNAFCARDIVFWTKAGLNGTQP